MRQYCAMIFSLITPFRALRCFRKRDAIDMRVTLRCAAAFAIIVDYDDAMPLLPFCRLRDAATFLSMLRQRLRCAADYYFRCCCRHYLMLSRVIFIDDGRCAALFRCCHAAYLILRCRD